MKKIILTISLVLISFAAHAGVSEKIKVIEDQEAVCLDNPDNFSDYGMRECVFAAFDSMDQLLNTEYNKYVRELKSKKNDQFEGESSQEILRRLIKTQRIWITYRDANSELSGIQNLGGTLERLSEAFSLVEMTKQRILELHGLFTYAN